VAASSSGRISVAEGGRGHGRKGSGWRCCLLTSCTVVWVQLSDSQSNLKHTYVAGFAFVVTYGMLVLEMRTSKAIGAITQCCCCPPPVQAIG
jgi:hypothetical protein